MNIRRTLREKNEVHTSALNDILFILLFFFLIIATLANPNVVKLAIPKAQSDTKAKQTVVVSVDAQQNFFVGTTPVDINNLENVVAQELQRSSDSEPTIVINADSSANAGQIVAIMRVAHALKARTVLAVDKN
jgi:biopolymer transport protein ExbD